MTIIHLDSIEGKEIVPGYVAQFIHTNHNTVAFWEIKKGNTLPEHSHKHEQVSILQKGRFELTVNGKTEILMPGQVVLIEPNAMHSGVAITDCTMLDIFYPVREDYKNE